MLVELGWLAGGVLPGWLLRGSRPAAQRIGQATLGTIYALLFILGARLGGDEALFQAMGSLGVQGVTVGLCCTLGSALCVLPAQKYFQVRKPGTQSDGNAEAGGLMRGMRGSLYILACFCLGLALGRLGLPPWLYTGNVFLYTLWAMLLCVGMGMGSDLGAFLILRDLGPRVLLVPVLTVAGTVLGAVPACLLLPLDLRSTLAVGAGFGYYSLSSVLVTELHGAALGSVTLIANIFRELFTILATPLLLRLLGPLAPIAAAGAPAMDTCLPGIVYFAGERYGFIALFSGLLLTVVTPFFVSFILRAA